MDGIGRDITWTITRTQPGRPVNSVIIYRAPSCGTVACIPPYMVYSMDLFMRPIIPESSVKYRNNSRARGYGTLQVIGMSIILSIISLALVIGCAILFMILAGIIHPSRILGRYSAGQNSQKILNISEAPAEENYYPGFLDVYRMRSLDGI
jgi:ABC-type Fe3+ transport system permease subunit